MSYRRPSRLRWSIENIRRTNDDRTLQQNRVYRTGKVAGVVITPDTAVTISAVWACIRYLSQTVAMLPWEVREKTEAGEKTVTGAGIWYMINKRVAADYSSFQFRETMLHWALRWGNAYAEIERDLAGRPSALHPIHPTRVQVLRDIDTQELIYRVSNNFKGGQVDLRPSEIFHIRGFGESAMGVNVLAYAADSIGWVKATQLFGASFFGNGASVTGLITSTKRLSPDGLQGIRDEWKTRYGGPRKGNSVAVLDNDIKYTPIGVEPDKGQFIETNQFLLSEICRWFGVPPHKIFDLLRGTFSNIEHQSIEVVTDSIMPWAKRFEDEADYKLIGDRSKLYTKLDLRELLRGDTTARMARYRALREIGVLNANEIRNAEGLEDIPKDDGGKKYVMQGQYTTLEKIGELPAPGSTMLGGGGDPVPEPEPAPEPEPTPEPEPKPARPDDTGNDPLPDEDEANYWEMINDEGRANPEFCTQDPARAGEHATT